MGGSGSSGAALNTGFNSAYMVLGHNIIFDSANGIFIHSGHHISVLDNLLQNIGDDSSSDAVGTALLVRGSNHEIYNNVIVNAERWGVMDANIADYRCNTAIDGGVPLTPSVIDVIADYNNYYNSTEFAVPGVHDTIQQDASQMQHTEKCFWRKQWTGPELICLPLGATTNSSPSVMNCDPLLGSRTDVGSNDALF
jgi:hypothetical protein